MARSFAEQRDPPKRGKFGSSKFRRIDLAKLKFGVYTEMQAGPGRSYQELVWEVFRLMEQADQLGFDVFSLIEHHAFQTFGISANPLAMFSAVAQRTRNLRFRTMCHTLPLHNPVVLAGEIATADILTGGRLDVGVGRGHAWLYPKLGIPLAESLGRYRDGLNILPLAWTKESFSYQGEYYRLEDVSVVPKPVQQPHPPVFLTGTSGQGFKTAAEKGWSICCGGPAPLDVFRPSIDIYREACKELGSNPYLAYVRGVFLAEDEKTAHREARESILNFYKYNVRPHDSLLEESLKQPLIEAGYGFYASDMMQQMKNISYDDLIDQDMVFVGTPDQVSNKIADLHSKIAFDEFEIVSHYGDIDLHKAYRTQEMFARQVMPDFR